jgi:hypothetical protein
MNSIKSISGLASSLLLTAGLTRIAEKLDPMLQNNESALTAPKDACSCEFSDYPCTFTPEAGQ